MLQQYVFPLFQVLPPKDGINRIFPIKWRLQPDAKASHR